MDLFFGDIVGSYAKSLRNMAIFILEFSMELIISKISFFVIENSIVICRTWYYTPALTSSLYGIYYEAIIGIRMGSKDIGKILEIQHMGLVVWYPMKLQKHFFSELQYITMKYQSI